MHATSSPCMMWKKFKFQFSFSTISLSLSMCVVCMLAKLRFIKGQPVAINFFLLFFSLSASFSIPSSHLSLTYTFYLHSPNFNTYTINNTPVKVESFVCLLALFLCMKIFLQCRQIKMLCLEINFYVVT